MELSSAAAVASLGAAALLTARKPRGLTSPRGLSSSSLRDTVPGGFPRWATGHARAPSARGGARTADARWAKLRELRPLLVRGTAPQGRLVLGSPVGKTVLATCRVTLRLAAEAGQSVAVVGPTQSGKTVGFAVPAILGWEGPVVAASVKTDLVRDTLAWRRRCGRVWCFDPGRTTGLPASAWSPLHAARTWAGARRVAADLTEVARSPATTGDGDFWFSTAAKLLAPLLFAAANGGRSMADVVRWVDTQEVGEVAEALGAIGVPEAVQAAQASWQRDERQRSSVYTTAETVLEPFAEMAAREPGWTGPGTFSGLDDVIDTEALLTGAHTLYLSAPAHDQRRLRHLFVALVKQVVDGAFARADRQGSPLRPPLLLVLDEAANIAPLAELDGLAATCAGHGVQLVTIWQDLAQISARYGPRAATVINNHRAKVFLSGTADYGTLEHASRLLGEEERLVPSVTRDASGASSVTSARVPRPLLPPDGVRRLVPGSGVLVYGALPPARLFLRPWWQDPALAARQETRRRGQPKGGDGRRRVSVR